MIGKSENVKSFFIFLGINSDQKIEIQFSWQQHEMRIVSWILYNQRKASENKNDKYFWDENRMEKEL